MKIYLFLFCFLFSYINLTSQSLTAGEVISRLKANLTCEWNEETVDTYKSGNHDTKITGIATTFLANLDVLKRAKEQGLNMVITHEPTFYNHFDDVSDYKNDPVYQAKLKFIQDNDMVVFRYHDHMHLTQPDGIYKALVDKLEWNDYHINTTEYQIPKTTLKELASFLRNKLNIKTIRVIGDPELTIKNVGMKLGATGSMTHVEMFRSTDIDVLLIGETREWESVEYVRDAISAGMNKSMIILGHAISEEDGMDYCAVWMKKFVKEVPVEFIAAKEPFWAPE